MTKRIITGALLAAALLLPQTAAAQECDGENVIAAYRGEQPAIYDRIVRNAAATENGEGVFWRIEADGVPASYLFGTIHVTDPRVTALPDTVTKVLKEASTVLVESTEALDQAAFRKNLGKYRNFMIYSDGSTLAAHLSPEQRAEVDAALKSAGSSLEQAGPLKPWMLATALAAPACEAARRADIEVVDAKIASIARANGATLAGLETTAEQFSAFDGISDKLQVEHLVATARMRPHMDDLFHTMASLYLDRRVAMIEAFSRELSMENGVSQAAYDAFNDGLVTKRNRTMRERALPYLEKGNVFIAVGALHLIGDTGLVATLRQAGYTVTRID